MIRLIIPALIIAGLFTLFWNYKNWTWASAGKVGKIALILVISILTFGGLMFFTNMIDSLKLF